MPVTDLRFLRLARSGVSVTPLRAAAGLFQAGDILPLGYVLVHLPGFLGDGFGVVTAGLHPSPRGCFPGDPRAVFSCTPASALPGRAF